jgi:uncharacterized protein YegP (UPF0339 family)
MTTPAGTGRKIQMRPAPRQRRRRRNPQTGRIVMAGMFELFVDADANFRFRLTAPDGTVMAVSKAFDDKPAAVAGISAVREYAGMGLITDLLPGFYAVKPCGRGASAFGSPDRSRPARPGRRRRRPGQVSPPRGPPCEMGRCSLTGLLQICPAQGHAQAEAGQVRVLGPTSKRYPRLLLRRPWLSGS